MPIQTSYSIDHGKMYAGQVVNHRLYDSMTGLAAADLAFGKGVIRSGNKVALPTSAAEAKKFIGVVERELNRALTDSQSELAPAGKDATIATRGDIAVKCTSGCAIGDPVFLIHDATNRGDFRNDADTSKAEAMLSWEFKTAASAGELAVIGVKATQVTA